VVVWFRDKDVTLALGITGGAVFSAPWFAGQVKHGQIHRFKGRAR
jgi:hypothetical protein